jgi:hypothetical protein
MIILLLLFLVLFHLQNLIIHILLTITIPFQNSIFIVQTIIQKLCIIVHKYLFGPLIIQAFPNLYPLGDETWLTENLHISSFKHRLSLLELHQLDHSGVDYDRYFGHHVIKDHIYSG